MGCKVGERDGDKVGLIVGERVGVNVGLIVLIWVNEWIRLDTISTENMAYMIK